MKHYHCPYLKAQVELSEEREKHITDRHPELLPTHEVEMAETIVEPDQVRLSNRFINAKLFTRWFEDVRSGKYIVVVVVSQSQRHWIITAYIARTLSGGIIEWERN